MSDTLSLPEGHSIYGYVPTLWVTWTFASLFCISFVLHCGLAIRFRKMWFLWLTFVIASLEETIGWAGRVWSSYDVFNIAGFQIQICCTISAPTFTVAGTFVILGRIIRQLGMEHSRMSPKAFTWTFVFVDNAALIVQAVGGGIASAVDPIMVRVSAYPSSTELIDKHDITFKQTRGNIMLAGIVFQLFVLIVSVLYISEYFFRFFTGKPLPARKSATQEHQEYQLGPRKWQSIPTRMRIMLMAMITAMFFIFVRAVYRTIELSEGWTGTVITTEVYFNLFDGMMILLAQYIFIFIHPGIFLQNAPVENAAELVPLSSVSTLTPHNTS